MEIMHPFTFFGNLLWFPRALQTVNPRPKRADATNAGFLAGLIGLGGFLAWLIPPDYLGISDVPLIEAVLNAAVGVIAGILMIFMLFGFEALVFGAFGFKGYSRTIKGAMGIFLLVPAACIPVHALFPDGLTAAGYQWIFWLIAGFFLAWHGTVMLSLVPSEHYTTKAPRFVTRKAGWVFAIALAGVELILAFIFFNVIPLAFRSDFADFMVTWI
jgi:hypothetical protein